MSFLSTDVFLSILCHCANGVIVIVHIVYLTVRIEFLIVRFVSSHGTLRSPWA